MKKYSLWQLGIGREQRESTQVIPQNATVEINGDVNVTGGDFVGHNKIIQIGSVQIPRSMLWLAAFTMLTILSLAILLLYWFWPEQTMPTGTFNIAVAELDVPAASEREGKKNEEAHERASGIAAFIGEQEDFIESITNQKLTIWGPDHGIKPIKQGEEKQRAYALNADVIIYGELSSVDDEHWELQPKFYLIDKAINQAEELAGEHALGKPIIYSNKLSGIGKVHDTLRKRIEALVQLLYGLSLMTDYDKDGYRDAAQVFQDAVDNLPWAIEDDNSGQEILYLFLGNAYLAESLHTNDTAPERHVLLEKSKAAFQQAIALNPAYARSLNGLGSTNFQLARATSIQDECDWKWPLLSDAEQAFTQALNTSIEEKAPSGQVDYRASFGLGRIYFWRGYCLDGHIEDWDKAQEHYQFVVDTFYQMLNPSPQVIDIATYTYTDLGFIALQKSEVYSINSGRLVQAKANKLRGEAIQYYDKVYLLIAQSNTADGKLHGSNTMPYYLFALCIDGNPEKAVTVLDDFTNLLPDKIQGYNLIMKKIDTQFWKECQNDKIQ